MASRLTHAAWFLGVFLIVGARDTSARTVFSHLGDDDPALSGWGATFAATVLRSPVAGSGIGDDLPAWQVHDTSTASGSTGQYLRTPIATDLSAAAQLGWLVRATVRVPDPGDALDASVYLELATDTRRFGLAFGSDASGNALVQVFGATGPVHTIAGASFHTYELRHHPASASADLYVDGALVESGSTGIDASGVAPRLIFGSSQSGTTGRGQYHRVEWIIHDDFDRDGVGDPEDNCAFIANPDQADAGGIGAASPPDGRGDVCQCAELDGDGRVAASDLALLRAHLADPATALAAGALARCSASDDPGACDLATSARIARALAGRAPPIAERCASATGFGALCGDGFCTGEPGSCWSAPPGCQADCGACLIGTPCNVDSDCASANCANAMCAANVPAPQISIPGDGRCDPGEECTQTRLGTDPDSCGRCQLDQRCHVETDCAAGLDCLRRGTCSVTGTPCPSVKQLGVYTCAPGLPPDLCAPASTGSMCDEPAPPGVPCNSADDCAPFGAVVGTCAFSIGEGFCDCPGRGGVQANPACEGNPEQPCLCESRCLEVNGICDDGSACFRDEDCVGPCRQWNTCVPTGCGGAGEPSCPEGAPCGSTSECASGLICHIGFCKSPFPDGAICTASAQCAGGICNFGICTSELRDDGEPCTTDAVCQSGVCEGLLCRVPNCGNGSCSWLSEICGTFTPSEQIPCEADCGKCAENHRCGANVDCETGYCDPDYFTATHSACRPCGEANAGLCPNGENCDDDVDCQGSSICQSSYCAPEPPPCSGSNRPNGCQCTSNSQCASDLCAVIPGHPDVCAPASCAGRLPGSLCTSHADCCDFPGVNISCSFFVCQP